MTGPMLKTYQAVVQPAQCDAMGHMNVQYYVAAFDQAMWNLVYSLGWRPQPDSRRQGFADVRHVIQYFRELSVGSPFAVESRPISCGASSLITQHRMVDVVTGKLSAEMEMTSVHFDLKARKSTPLSASFGEAIAQFLERGETAKGI